MTLESLSYTSGSFHTTIYAASTPEVRIIHTPSSHKPCYKIAHVILGYVSLNVKKILGLHSNRKREKKEEKVRREKDTKGQVSYYASRAYLPERK
jgi:hypothetical protein